VTTSRVLRYLWRSFLEGAAMSATATHGWPNPEYFQSDVARREGQRMSKLRFAPLAASSTTSIINGLAEWKLRALTRAAAVAKA
jgi:hypothetical protein